MNRRYRWTSQGSAEQSPDEMEPDWPEIRFPVKIAREPGDRTDYSLYEFSAEVMTPDGELDQGDVRLRGGSLFVRFQPYEEGLHKVQVLADGMEFCPALFFDVSPDGSHRRLKSPPPGGHPMASRRQRVLTRRRPSQRSSASQGSDDDDAEVVRRGRTVHRSSSRASASSGYGGLNRRGSFRQSDDSLERFAAASARYSVASSYDESSRPGSASRHRRNSSLSRHSSNASRRSFNREAFSDSDLVPIATEHEKRVTKKKTVRRESSGSRRTHSPPPTSPGRTRPKDSAAGRARSPAAARMPRQGSASAMSVVSAAGSGGGEVLVSPSGDMFFLSGGQALNLRVVGRAPSGAQLTQSSTGEMFLVQDGKAVPLQRNAGGVLMTEDQSKKKKKTDEDQYRCSVCNRKTRAKKRSIMSGFTYCKKHFKRMYFKKSPYEHKAFLFEPPEVVEPGKPVHPKGNFTGLSFKEFHRAQEEFAKYDVEQKGSILKDLIRPILNSLLLLHPVNEKKLREYFLGPRYVKVIQDMGLTDASEVTELQFINLMAVIVRETTLNWLKKVNLGRPPMQKSWSTSVLEVRNQRFAGFPGQPYQGMPPGQYGYGYPLYGSIPPHGVMPDTAQQRRLQYANTRIGGSEGAQFPQRAPHGEPRKTKKTRHAFAESRRSDPDGLEEDAVMQMYDEDDEMIHRTTPGPSSRRGVAVGQDDLEPAIGSTILEETEEDDDEEDKSRKTKGKREHTDEDEENEGEDGVEEEDDDDDDDNDDDDQIDEEDKDESSSDSSLPITGHEGADGWMLY